MLEADTTKGRPVRRLKSIILETVGNCVQMMKKGDDRGQEFGDTVDRCRGGDGAARQPIYRSRGVKRG
jgi:hypothetical protein